MQTVTVLNINMHIYNHPFEINIEHIRLNISMQTITEIFYYI